MELNLHHIDKSILDMASRVQLVITDCDGVLTDNGVYFSEKGEAMKRFSIRDGMGVERLREKGIETAIMTGENSLSVAKRAEKLKIKYLYLGSKDKRQVLDQVVKDTGYLPQQMAYIGDDVNDLEVMGLIAFTACPEDAMFMVKERANYICKEKGGYGAFRELAELILYAKQHNY